MHLKQLDKEEHKKSKVTKKEIIKIRAEINEMRMKKTIEKINETKTKLFESINKIGKPLARLIKKNGRRLKSELEIKMEKSYTAQKCKG